MKVAIVKYNAGNIYSVVNAMRRLGVEPIITDDAEVLASADRVLFPGQGEASSTMAYIKEHQLDRIILDLKQPVLGICIGQQLLCKHSEEGNTDCMGLFPMEVKRFQPTCHEDKVPAIGWNRIELGDEPCKLFKGLGANPYVYFIHSYYVPVVMEHGLQPTHTFVFLFGQTRFSIGRPFSIIKMFNSGFSLISS